MTENALRERISREAADDAKFPKAYLFPASIFRSFTRLRHALETRNKGEANRAREQLGLSTASVEFAREVWASVPEYDKRLAQAAAEEAKFNDRQPELQAFVAKMADQGFLSRADREAHNQLERQLFDARTRLVHIRTIDPRPVIGELWGEDLAVNSERMRLCLTGTYTVAAELHNKLLACGVLPEAGRWTDIDRKPNARKWWESPEVHKARLEEENAARAPWDNYTPTEARQ